MIRNLKALGLALLAVCALGAIVAQGASAAVEHDFHAEEEEIVVTGKNVGKEKFQVGAAGTVECTTSEFESTQQGKEAVEGNGTWETDTITVIPRYTGCEFGGQPATVKINHCAYIFDSDTTTGNSDGGEHANVEIECSGGSQIEIHTSVCTILVGAQTIPHALRYTNKTASSITVNSTAKKIVTGKVRNTAAQPVNGCLTFPTGAIGTYTGESTAECFKDDGSTITDATVKTTPALVDGATRKCTVAPA